MTVRVLEPKKVELHQPRCLDLVLANWVISTFSPGG
jgi:hypothetical protein